MSLDQQDSTRPHQFTLVLAASAQPLAQLEDGLYQAGCDDALLSLRGETPLLDFTRRAPSLAHAMLDGIAAVEGHWLGLRVVRAKPDDLINAAGIAQRANVSREAVRMWTTGERAGGFPQPVAWVGRSMIWSWLEVAEWLHQRGRLPAATLDEARFLAALKIYLGRRGAPGLTRQLRLIRQRLGA